MNELFDVATALQKMKELGKFEDKYVREVEREAIEGDLLAGDIRVPETSTLRYGLGDYQFKIKEY